MLKHLSGGPTKTVVGPFDSLLPGTIVKRYMRRFGQNRFSALPKDMTYPTLGCLPDAVEMTSFYASNVKPHCGHSMSCGSLAGLPLRLITQ
jgi:hypothetical protein